jgi:hypothetical protein
LRKLSRKLSLKFEAPNVKQQLQFLRRAVVEPRVKPEAFKFHRNITNFVSWGIADNKNIAK